MGSRYNFKDPATLRKILSDIQNVKLTAQEMMELQSHLESNDTTPPFPARKAKKTLATVLAAKKLDEISFSAINQIHSWCKEDFYMESICEIGVIDVIIHVLHLCEAYAEHRQTNNIKTKIPEDIKKIRLYSIHGAGEVFLNENNADKVDVVKLYPVIVRAIFQEGALFDGFPMDVTTICFSIKTLAELLRPLMIQGKGEHLSKITEDEELLTVIRNNIREGTVIVPSTKVALAADSIFCTLRFVMNLLVCSPRSVILLRELGFVEVIQVLKPSQASAEPLHQQCLDLLNGDYSMSHFPSVSKPHTKEQRRRFCSNCNKPENPTTPLLVCSACKSKRYCNRDCQVSHWKAGHSRECKLLKSKK